MRSYSFCATKKAGRLDVYLAMLFPQLTRNYIQELIRTRHILLNERFPTRHKTVKKGDRICIEIPPLRSTGILPSNIPLDIIYENRDILVINKSAGIVVHPSDTGGHVAHSIVNALLYHRPKDFPLKNTVRPGIVHRLDKDTSGLLVIAKNDTTRNYLSRQWQERKVHKIYTALVHGLLKPVKGIIEAPVGRSVSNRKQLSVRTGKGGRFAITEYEVKKYFRECSLLSIHIPTGRTHQIRVHFQSIGYPIVGDATYGNERINRIFAERYRLHRQFLHASRLGFYLPHTKQWREFEAPLPKDLSSVLSHLK